MKHLCDPLRCGGETDSKRTGRRRLTDHRVIIGVTRSFKLVGEGRHMTEQQFNEFLPTDPQRKELNDFGSRLPIQDAIDLATLHRGYHQGLHTFPPWVPGEDGWCWPPLNSRTIRSKKDSMGSAENFYTPELKRVSFIPPRGIARCFGSPMSKLFHP